jgi:hypothetical protein
MKKPTFILFILLLCGKSLFSQSGGAGTLANPYYGDIYGNVTWNPTSFPQSTIYALDLTIRGNATLTIAASRPGGILRFFYGYPLTIESTGNFVIQPGSGVTVGTIFNNGNVTLKSDGSEFGSASLIIDSYSGSMNTNVEIYLPGGQYLSNYIWHYVSAPISNITAITFNDYDPLTPFNLAKYLESNVVNSNLTAGWYAYDGYHYAHRHIVPDTTFTLLTLGQGYNYYFPTDRIVTLTTSNTDNPTRLLNVSNINIPVRHSGYSNSGWNLIGNPFTSCLNWNLIRNTMPFVEDAIYFTLFGRFASYVGGVGANGGTGTIPPMQGFFVHTTGTSSVPLVTSARVHNTEQLRYKGTGDNNKSSDTISFVRLKFENQKDSNDLVVRFNKKATVSFDKMFDAYKLDKNSGVFCIWTKTGNVDYSINGLPFPETSVEIPVAINTSEVGIYKLSSNELKNLDNYSVTLKDLSTNITVDLKKGAIMVFNAPAGITENRFVLTVTNIATSVPEIILPSKKFSIYSSGGTVNNLSLTDEFNNIPGVVNIYDLSGRIVMQESNVVWQSNGELRKINLIPAEKGLYIVEIKAGNKKYVEKVNLNK